MKNRRKHSTFLSLTPPSHHLQNVRGRQQQLQVFSYAAIRIRARRLSAASSLAPPLGRGVVEICRGFSGSFGCARFLRLSLPRLLPLASDYDGACSILVRLSVALRVKSTCMLLLTFWWSCYPLSHLAGTACDRFWLTSLCLSLF